jgi:hypothetical protein
MTLKEAASELGVGSTRAVRYILKLDSSKASALIHGYDPRGRVLVDRALVMAKAKERLQRGNWRARNLKGFECKAKRNAEGARMCYRLNCRSTVTGRNRLCERHRRLSAERRAARRQAVLSGRG